MFCPFCRDRGKHKTRERGDRRLEASAGEVRGSRRRLGINEEKVWVQRTPIGQALVVYWETDDPQRALREMADSQDEVDNMLKQFIETNAPALDLTKEQPLSNELILEWPAR